MKKLLLGLCLVPALSFAKTVSLPNADISFNTPDNFTPLSQEVISEKWPSEHAPEWAVGVDDGETTIAYSVRGENVSQVPMSELLTGMSTLFERAIPDIEWKNKEVVTINGTDWAYLEFTSSGLENDVHNIVLVAPYEDQAVMFNFNSSKVQFVKYEGDIRQSIKTIQVH